MSVCLFLFYFSLSLSLSSPLHISSFLSSLLSSLYSFVSPHVLSCSFSLLPLFALRLLLFHISSLPFLSIFIPPFFLFLTSPSLFLLSKYPLFSFYFYSFLSSFFPSLLLFLKIFIFLQFFPNVEGFISSLMFLFLQIIFSSHYSLI